ncbi:hypothetical protein [Sphingosinicella terrae]|uniref:hypothetical protein n=1 Tax=Sphingosinicella terrae TaxID=2172047 RepID=UPI000E0DA2C4|nr:hypothetical protein [Sphingosinicella terrae]
MKIAAPFARLAIAAALATVAACGTDAQADPPSGADPRDPRAWTIGPIIRGRNYSRGVPLQPSPARRGAWQIDLPRAPGSVHYVTFRHGSLAGKSRIVLRYRVEADPGVRIEPITAPGGPSIITLYFQRGGDNWSARGRFEAYRWYATFASHSPIAPGEHEMVAPLDGPWTAVESSSARTAPAAFRDALENADQVGFVLGGGDGYGHGVFATGRARLIVTDFRVE